MHRGEVTPTLLNAILGNMLLSRLPCRMLRIGLRKVDLPKQPIQ